MLSFGLMAVSALIFCTQGTVTPLNWRYFWNKEQGGWLWFNGTFSTEKL